MGTVAINNYIKVIIFIASHQHNATGLKEIALEYIIKHLNDPAVATPYNIYEVRA